MFSHRCHGVFAVGCALVLTGLAGCALLSQMIVLPGSLDFGQTDTSKSFNVSFSGVSLVWAVAVDPAAAPWLSVAPASGRGAATVTVTVNRGSLPAASNTGTIIVTDQNQKQVVVQVSATKAADGGDDGGGGGGGGGGNVPNVVGQAQAAAQNAITAVGLTVGAVTQQCSNTVPAGNVISQNPAGGATAAAGAAVSLVVSSGTCGGGAVNVPNIVGLDPTAAQNAITAAGLTVGAATQQCSDAVPAGTVISQNPAGGTTVAAGAAVSLVVSYGPCGGGGGTLDGKWYYFVQTWDESKGAMKSFGNFVSLTFTGNTVEILSEASYLYKGGITEEDKEAVCSQEYFYRGTYSTNTQTSPFQVDMTFTEEGWYEYCDSTYDGDQWALSPALLFSGIFSFVGENLVLSGNWDAARPSYYGECADFQFIMIPESQLASYPYWYGWDEYYYAYDPDCYEDCWEECYTDCDSDGYCWDECYWVCSKDGAVVQKKNPLDRLKGIRRR